MLGCPILIDASLCSKLVIEPEGNLYCTGGSSTGGMRTCGTTERYIAVGAVGPSMAQP